MTRQKELIFDIVSASPSHMTAEEIYALARARMPSVARGTVYRNLGQLTQAGLIGKLEMPGAPARYDRESRSHPHLVCWRCGRVEDLCLGGELTAALLSAAEEEITGYELKLFHICPECKKNQEVIV